MIERFNALKGQNVSTAGDGGRVINMVRNDRTAGSIPSWDRTRVAEGDIEASLTDALRSAQKSGPNSAHRLSYQDGGEGPLLSSSESLSSEGAFGFKDVLDMVNPLQHIPLVGYIYREITGDDIKPAGRILGGALFGGPAGAAGGLVSVVLAEEMDKDSSVFKSPEEDISLAVQKQDVSQMPDSPALLGFADISQTSSTAVRSVTAAGGRTAGTIASYSKG